MNKKTNSFKGKSNRNADSFKRNAPRFNVNATVLIVCEDSKSSKNYLDDAKKHFDVEAEVEVVHCGKTDPLGIVNHALSRQKSYDKIYCVIDRDTHENFDEANALIKGSTKIVLIVSFPCFEFWLLLHFYYSRKSYARIGNKSPGDQMVSDLKKCLGMDLYDKGTTVNLFENLRIKLPAATERAIRVMVDAESVDDFNPSTKMHALFDAFEVLSKSRR